MKFTISLVLLAISSHLIACSMYKITVDGKTMVGCNEDAWRLTSRIWFEVGNISNPYGAAFTGSRFDGKNGFAPQSGMNEHGLAFSRLASYDPGNGVGLSYHKQAITNPTQYLKDIMHRCKDVNEVQQYIDQFDHSFFHEDVFIYIDSTGRYLIVEPYLMAIGDDPSYVLSNFCPSATSEADKLKLNRYQKGAEFLRKTPEASLNFCTALSDTMHVCRKKIGDGTLLTSIWNLRDGTTNLYFYHDYNQSVQFDLKEELSKGDHILDVAALFPPNDEFKQLANYKIPQNSLSMMFLLIFVGLLFLFSSIFFLLSHLISKSPTTNSFVKLLLIPIGIMVFCYMIILNTNMNIFYFESPYYDHHSIVLSMASYIPFLILIMLIPIVVFTIRILRDMTWSIFSKCLLTLNSLALFMLAGLFGYWGFYNVF